MANVLKPHHLDQFAARHHGVSELLATGKLPRLDAEGRARLYGLDRDPEREIPTPMALAIYAAAALSGFCVSVMLASAVVLLAQWVA